MHVSPLLALLACSTLQQDCPKGQVCAAAWDIAHAEECAERGECIALPASSEIELALPVPEGERVYCAKGNLRPHTTHNACNAYSRFALDLMSPAFEPPHLVLASADGVAFYYDGCPSIDLNRQPRPDLCNGGLGNVVRVEHAPELFTQYAHLSAILVRWGQRVRRGQPIGIEGDSGDAGAKHIHFSLHRGDPVEGAPSVPMLRLRTRAGMTSAAAIHCGDWPSNWTPDPTSVLVSDNRSLPPPAGQFGFWPALERWQGAALSSDGPARKRAIAALRAFGDEVEAHYWLGVALLGDGQLDEARRLFSTLTTSARVPRWLPPWSWLRLAEVEIAAHRRQQAVDALAHAEASGFSEEPFRKQFAQARRATDH